MKKLVIIGGGFAGSKIAKALEKNFDTTLIDTKDYFEFTPGILPAIVDMECMKEIQVMHSHYLSHANIIIGQVKKISEKEVSVNSKKIPFDYLVIASGSSYSFPFKEKDMVFANRAGELREHYTALTKAKKILIIGGGFTGVELAGEIACKYPEKETTIVHSMDRLLERQPKRVSNYARKILEKHGVRIIFNELIDSCKNDVYCTKKGTKIKTDLAFLCVGITPNSGFMKSNFSKLLDKRGHIATNQFLQMKDHKNIFVAGDVTDLKEEKTAQSALEHADIIIENLKRLENQKPLKSYTHIDRGMLISLGPHKGILSKGNFVLTGFIPRIIKSYIQRKQMMSL